MNLDERFWSKVEPTGFCWNWMGSTDQDGYGKVQRDRRTLRPHRVSYELLVGPIPEGLVIDHLCRNRLCINPDHLEPVTQAENARRGRAGAHQIAKTHCPQGHEYAPENTYRSPSGKTRLCRACNRAKARARLAGEFSTWTDPKWHYPAQAMGVWAKPKETP